MTLTNATGSVVDPLTNVTLPTLSVTSGYPYFFVVYNLVTKAIVGKVEYRTKGTTTTKGGIVACDTYANLQAAATAAGLTGTLSADPTPGTPK